MGESLICLGRVFQRVGASMEKTQSLQVMFSPGWGRQKMSVTTQGTRGGMVMKQLSEVGRHCVMERFKGDGKEFEMEALRDGEPGAVRVLDVLEPGEESGG